MRRLLTGVLAGLFAAGCGAAGTTFSDVNARAHVNMLAGTIGSRPTGSDANRRARAYIAQALELYGFQVEAREVVARLPDAGRSARLTNIVAVKPGSRPEAIALVAHHDSVPGGPGAGDDAFGVAVVLEAGRVLAAEPREHTLLLLITDGEELGLMGAAAAMEDAALASRIAVALNFDAVGAGGPALLFEAGGEDAWLVAQWARAAPRPRGSSLALEVYRRLPDDTDFSVLRRAGVPGLNFAIVGDSFAYHTARDTPDRLQVASLRHAGDGAIALVRALDRIDLQRRATGPASYFDVLGLTAVSYGRRTGSALAIAVMLVGLLGWWRSVRGALAAGGGAGLAIAAAWTILAAIAGGAATFGVTWALRASREVYHPWYAHPDRLLALIALAGVTAGWLVVRVGAYLPEAARGLRHPCVVWSVTLPVWVLLTGATAWLAPGAAYLWIVPTGAAGLVALAAAPDRPSLLRAAGLVVFAAAALVWLRDLVVLGRFLVAVFGRLPMVTPIFAHPALVLAGLLALVPGAVAAGIAGQRARRPAALTAGAMLALVVATALCYSADAYTPEQPLRRRARFVQDDRVARAFWEVGGNEPGLDLDAGQPFDWRPASDALPLAAPLSPLDNPFVFRAETPERHRPPADVTAAVSPRPQEAELAVTVLPREEGLAVTFVLPPGLQPVGANLPGIVRASGRWSATFVAPPPEGLTFRAFFDPGSAGALGDTVVVLTTPRLPGAPPGDLLPAWLRADRTVWRPSALYVVRPLAAAGAAPGGGH